jgi:two-component system, NarL family, nitrate/nitrite response regulator NarL
VQQRMEQLLDRAEATLLGRVDHLQDADEELVDEADILLVDATEGALGDWVDARQEAELRAGAKVVALVDHEPAGTVNRAMRAGVAAVLSADVSGEQLAAALQAVSRGLAVFQPEERRAARSMDGTPEGLRELIEPLTAREREVLEMLARGLGNKEIAGRLKISEHTVKFHVASILGKLGASTRTEAVSVALRQGLILL